MATLHPGETRIIERQLYQADGTTALLVSSLAAASVELRQNGEVIDTLVLGTDPELRQGSSTSKLALELTSALTALLSPGVPLMLRWKLTVVDALFTVEPSSHFKDFTDEEVYDIAA